MRYVYLGEIPTELGGGPESGFSEDEVLEGIAKISNHLEIQSLWEAVLQSDDRRLSRQRRTEEVERGRNQLEVWFTDNVIKHKVIVGTEKVDDVKWDSNNGIFADVLLRADQPVEQDPTDTPTNEARRIPTVKTTEGPLNRIPIGPAAAPLHTRPTQKSTLFPVHRAMLLRSEFFLTMFSSGFREAQSTPHIQIIPIDCTPDVLEIVLTFLYTEKADFAIDKAVDVLFAADLLLIERLKQKAAVIISTLGNGTMAPASDLQIVGTERPAADAENIDIYDVVRAGWMTRVPRLEEFGARYFAYRLESYIDEDEFADLIKESAGRIRGRQETDSIELLDDIRYYLSERFRLRFEDSGLEDMMAEEGETGDEERRPEEGTEDEGVDVSGLGAKMQETTLDNGEDGSVPQWNGAIRTLDGEVAGDEFASDAVNYQILLGKIDRLLERLKLDA